MPKYTNEQLKQYPGLGKLPQGRINELLDFWDYVNHLVDAMAFNSEPLDGKPVTHENLPLKNFNVVCTYAAMTYKDHCDRDLGCRYNERRREELIAAAESDRREISKLKRRISDMKRRRKSKKKKGN